MITDQAGFLQEGDIVRLRRSGVARVLGYKPGAHAYPCGSLVVSGWDGPMRIAALPWDEFELIAQAINSERDIEGE